MFEVLCKVLNGPVKEPLNERRAVRGLERRRRDQDHGEGRDQRDREPQGTQCFDELSEQGSHGELSLFLKRTPLTRGFGFDICRLRG